MAVNPEMNRIFQKVAREIGRKYTTLGRQLDVPNAAIENIEDENRRNEDRAYCVLVKWYQQNGQAGATTEVLGKALEAIRQKSIAEAIGYYETKPEDTAKDKKSRPFSEILHRRTSLVKPPRRSNTDSAVVLTGYRIPSPSSIYTTTSSRPLPSPEMIHTECTQNTEQVGKPEIIRTCCPNCGYCFEQQISVSEISLDRNCNQSNPDPMLHKRIAYNQDGSHDSKL